MPLADTYRRKLHDRALDQYGYVTTRDGEALGVPAVELRKLAHRGGLEHIGHGLYRFDDIPRTRHDQYMEAVLRVGPGAYLTHDAVLAVHDLALVNPRRIKVATPKRVRLNLPGHIQLLKRELDNRDLTTYEGIPTTTVRRALLDCRGFVMQDRLLQAAHDATRRGLLRRDQAKQVVDELSAAP